VDSQHDSTNPKSRSVDDLYNRLEDLIKQLPKERKSELIGMLSEGTLVNDLKAAILDSGQTTYAIGKASGVSPGMIDRFIRGERDLRLTTAGKLCEVLNLRLMRVEPQPEQPAKKASKKKPSK